jgi:two-component sensor histidine kinase
MKNMLAMVQAVTTQTLRHVSDRDAVETLTQRLHALSDANEVLQQENWAAASLTEVVTKALAVFGRPERFKVEGPAVELGPRATLSLSLLLHELGTNAVKYGALSVAEGRVAVSWQVKVDENEPVLALCWQESGGPHVPAPTSRGFGSRLIQLGLVGTGGTVVTYSPEGLAAEMRAPLSQLQDS